MSSQLWVLFIFCNYYTGLTVTLISRGITASVAAVISGETGVIFSLPLVTDQACMLHAALISYDYALTIALEIELFWRRPKRSWGFTLFVANRYLTVLGHTPFLVYAFWTPRTPSDYSVNLTFFDSRFIPYSDMETAFLTLSVVS